MLILYLEYLSDWSKILYSVTPPMSLSKNLCMIWSRYKSCLFFRLNHRIHYLEKYDKSSFIWTCSFLNLIWFKNRIAIISSIDMMKKNKSICMGLPYDLTEIDQCCVLFRKDLTDFHVENVIVDVRVMLQTFLNNSFTLYDSALIFRLLLHFNEVMKNASINLLSLQLFTRFLHWI